MIINYVMQYLYDKFKAYNKILGIIIFSLLLSTQVFADKKADKRFEKDLKKFQKIMGSLII